MATTTAAVQPVSIGPGTESAGGEMRPLAHRARALRLLAYVHLRNIHRSTGAGRVARQMTEHLARRDDVQMRILADRGDYERVVPQVGQPWSEFEYSFFAAETSRQQARWFLLDRPQAGQYWPDADVVFCTGESYVPKGKARLAVTLHDAAYFETGAHQVDRGFRVQQLKWRLLYGRLARRADLFHVVSHFSAERIAHFFPELRPRLKVVHNAITPHFFGPVSPEGELYLQAGGLANRPYLLVPGGLHYRKNAELILEVWPRLKALFPELRLVVVNHSNPEYADRLQAQGGNVFLAGFVSDEALQALYAGAEAVWFPSRYEGFGLPVVEAMACGAPVLASRSSSLPEIGGDAVLFAEGDSAEGHLAALEGLLTDKALRRELAARGKQRALQFTWPKAAAELRAYLGALV